jgi:Fe-S-cluster containining protein
MDDHAMFIPSLIGGTSAEDPYRGICEIYQKADADMAAFREKAQIPCPSGCGACCDHFEPDIVEAEALYLAAWLMGPGADKRSMLEREDRPDGCPFWLADDPYHCQVYPARGLICRLFGFSGMRNSLGEAEFNPCFKLREMKITVNAETAKSAPVMSDYGDQVVALCPDSAGLRLPLREGVRRSLAKLELIKRMQSA